MFVVFSAMSFKMKKYFSLSMEHDNENILNMNESWCPLKFDWILNPNVTGVLKQKILSDL